MFTHHYDHELDTTGLQCPLPLIRAKKVITSLPEGSVLRVISTDAGSVDDFSAFAKLTGHVLLASYEEKGKFYFLLQK